MRRTAPNCGCSCRALQSCALALPFHYLFHTPVSYLLGTAKDTSWAAFGSVFVRQLGWTIGFGLVGLGLYRRSVRRFVSAEWLAARQPAEPRLGGSAAGSTE